MLDVLRSRKIDREKLSSFSEIEKIKEQEKGKSENQRIEALIMKKFDESGLGERINLMNARLEEISGMIEDLMFLYQSNSRQKDLPSPRKNKIKEMIGLLLKQHGSLSAPQLCKLLNLSRTRCSEYLKEMELKGLLQAELNCRKKFYSVRQEGQVKAERTVQARV